MPSWIHFVAAIAGRCDTRLDCNDMRLKFAVGWRRYVEIFWYAVESAREQDTMIKIPHMSDQFKAAIVGILVMLAVQFVPQLEPLQDDMAEIASVIIAAIVGKSLVSERGS